MKKILAKNTKNNSKKNELPIWNLNDLYQSITDKKIDEDFKNIENECQKFCQKYQNKIAKIDAKNLFQAIQNYEKISEKIGKISTYSYLVYVSDLSNQKYLIFYQNISEKLSIFENKLIFFTL